jgi:hypothetical protein
MPSPAQGLATSSPATETWWSTFLDAHGRDSEEEAGFVGFLTTNGIAAGAAPDVLQEAYTNFRMWMQESEDREADRGPDRATLAAEQAVIALEQQFVAKSRVSAPGVEKPPTAATRPKETREPLGEGRVGPEGEANVAPASSHAGAPAPAPPVHAEGSAEAHDRRQGRRSGEGGSP